MPDPSAFTKIEALIDQVLDDASRHRPAGTPQTDERAREDPERLRCLLVVQPSDALDDVRGGDSARRLDHVPREFSQRPPACAGSIAQQGECLIDREVVAFGEDPVGAFDDETRVERALELPHACFEFEELLSLKEGVEGQPLDLLRRRERAWMAVGAVRVWVKVVSFAPLRLCA